MTRGVRTRAAQGIRTPRQERSRQSFERVLDAATELLMEVGYDGLTLAGVSARAGVSTGSIYGRIRGKDDLLTAVQARILERTEAGQDAMLARLQAGELPLDTLVPRAVDALGDFMQEYAGLLRPLMAQAMADIAVAGRGKASYGKLRDGWIAVILSRRDDIAQRPADAAVLGCFRIAYAAFARYLGLGSSMESAGEGDWAALKRNLGVMCLAFLKTPAGESSEG
ncbi:AcrR family transcriptional regulator [Deinococcus metalli]|nr:TetR/AcrR family transcriptional regulator [Deinococcus metalli]MBB5376779.1 AcrR family transcriptional regulator [Deinococcus metalli]